jgi:hypothetical protein
MDHGLPIVLVMLKVKKKGTVMSTDDFDDHYNHGDEPQQNNQEEAHFYWTLREFESLIDQHGAAFILAELDSNVVKLLKDKLNERL